MALSGMLLVGLGTNSRLYAAAIVALVVILQVLSMRRARVPVAGNRAGRAE